MLELQQVTKAFDGVLAVDHLSLSIGEGTIVGFLGPNGAGKTTTMRMILDILRPDSGTIRWRGRPIGEDVRRRFGYMPEDRGLYPKMRVDEQLVHFARLYGMERAPAQRAVTEWLERFDLGDRSRSRAEELSKGNQQKIQVLAALVHRPSLALLDEPFSGLDPANSEMLTRTLLELRDQGSTVIFSSHRLEQVEELCEEVAIIANGRLRLTGRVEELRGAAVRPVVHVRVVGGGLPDVEGLPVRRLEDGRGFLRYALVDGADAQSILAALVQRERLEFFALERPSLQEIFLEATA